MSKLCMVQPSSETKWMARSSRPARESNCAGRSRRRSLGEHRSQTWISQRLENLLRPLPVLDQEFERLTIRIENRPECPHIHPSSEHLCQFPMLNFHVCFLSFWVQPELNQKNTLIFTCHKQTSTHHVSHHEHLLLNFCHGPIFPTRPLNFRGELKKLEMSPSITGFLTAKQRTDCAVPPSLGWKRLQHWDVRAFVASLRTFVDPAADHQPGRKQNVRWYSGS